MHQALTLAQEAELAGEVPVGAVLVQQHQIIGTGFNQVIQCHDPSAHAEIQALRNAGKHLENYRFPNTTLYVTLEPCLMCLGSLIHARIQRLVYATPDLKTGALGGAFEVTLPPKFQVESHLLAAESQALLQGFFQHKRALKSRQKSNPLP